MSWIPETRVQKDAHAHTRDDVMGLLRSPSALRSMAVKAWDLIIGIRVCGQQFAKDVREMLGWDADAGNRVDVVHAELVLFLSVHCTGWKTIVSGFFQLSGRGNCGKSTYHVHFTTTLKMHQVSLSKELRMLNKANIVELFGALREGCAPSIDATRGLLSLDAARRIQVTCDYTETMRRSVATLCDPMAFTWSYVWNHEGVGQRQEGKENWDIETQENV
ncbi:hypothetical protein FVE85_2799 [Porphyridium purpureum]|uniref:Uncharacterized protein n=1 Tax=Porphyridium purpureum TaxID=35688 RepID=A0A5J4YTQ1_PORPP|nr:hypothetical protein FVE85_2799 [Porphyridium purpureum]|eukprot:POR6697..scf227_4